MGLKDKARTASAVALGTVALVVVCVGYLSLHLLTVAMLYTRHGLLVAAAGLFLPAIAEVYMFIRSWVEVGFLNLYTLLFLGIPAAWILLEGLPALLSSALGGGKDAAGD